MKLESSKQGFIMLSAFHNAGHTGMTYTVLASEMAKICTEMFGENDDNYVNIPVPLNTLISNAYRDDEIVINETGDWRITRKGERSYRFLKTYQESSLGSDQHH